MEQTIEVGTQTATTLKGQVCLFVIIVIDFDISLPSLLNFASELLQTEQMGRIVNELDTIQFSIKKASQLVKEIGRQVSPPSLSLSLSKSSLSFHILENKNCLLYLLFNL